MLLRRHVIPSGLAAAAAVGVSEYGAIYGKALVTGLHIGPSAGLGAITGLFYSATYDMLPVKTGIGNLLNHSIALITSAAATYGAAFALASAGLIAMPTLTSLTALFAAAVIVNILFRAIFGGPHPRQAVAIKAPEPRKPPQSLPRPISIPEPLRVSLPKPLAPVAPVAVAAPAVEPAKVPSKPAGIKWPADLSKIGIRAYPWDDQQQIEDYLKVVVPEIKATGKLPDFHRKYSSFYFKGKFWTLPRTLTFIEDPKTKKLSAILLNVSKDDVRPLGKGRERTAKIIYDLMSGQRLVKKIAASDYEVELLQKLNNSKGFEPLLHVRKVMGKNYLTKTQLITPVYKGTLKQLLEKNPALSAKDVRKMMLSLLTGLENLHALPERRGSWKEYNSYHSDIKPANLLYDETAEGYDAVISDVGTVNDLNNLWATLGWMSPEKIKQWYGLSYKKPTDTYNMENSQKDDIWSMGLVFASLLKNKLAQCGAWNELVPLECIYKKCEWNRDDRNISTITQGELNAEFLKIKAQEGFKPDSLAKETMWDIVRRMLLVDPNRRLTARQARAQLEAVVV